MTRDRDRRLGWDDSDDLPPPPRRVSPGKVSGVVRAYGAEPVPRPIMRKPEIGGAGELGELGNTFQTGANQTLAKAAQSSGEPLPKDLRQSMASSLGADLGAVRVHTGSESAAAAKSVQAKAYATGQDIHFAAGQYDPASAIGQHLLAHEVAHTVQQTSGSAHAGALQRKGTTPAADNDAHEQAADDFADDVTTNLPDHLRRKITRTRVLIESFRTVFLANYRRAVDRLDANSISQAAPLLVEKYKEAKSAFDDIAAVQTAGVAGPAPRTRRYGTVEQMSADPNADVHAGFSALKTSLKRLERHLATDVGASYFRFHRVPGTSVSMPPDIAAFVAEASAKVMLLVLTLHEVKQLIGSDAEGTTGEARKRAIAKLEAWSGDSNAFLFLGHVLEAEGHAGLLDEKGAKGKSLRATFAEVAEGVPQTVDEIIEHLWAAKRLATGEPPNTEGAIKLLEQVERKLFEIAGDNSTVEAAFRRRGLALAQATTLIYNARSVPTHLRRALQRGRLIVSWHEIGHVEAARDPLEVVVGEREFGDSVMSTVEEWGYVAPAVIAGAPTAVLMLGAAAPAIIAEASLIAQAGASAWTAAMTWALANPATALAVTDLTASIGLSMADAGGVENFLEQLSTPEGVLSLVVDLLVLHQSSGGGQRAGSGRSAQQPSAQRSGALKRRGQEVAQKVKAAKLAISRWAGEQMQPAHAGATAGGPDMPAPTSRKGLSHHYETAKGDLAEKRRRELGALGESSPEVDAVHGSAEVPAGRHLPREGLDKGWWDGQRGHSNFHSDNPAVNEITGGKPIPFRNGHPDFSEWADDKVFILGGRMTGTNADFRIADRNLARKRGWSNTRGEPDTRRATQHRRQNNLTWHHVEDAETMQLVPSDLNNNVPHVGGAAAARDQPE